MHSFPSHVFLFENWKLLLWRGCLVIYLEYITSCNIIVWSSKVFTALQSALMVGTGSCSAGVSAKIPQGCAGQLSARVSTGLGALCRELRLCSAVELQSTPWWESTGCQYITPEPELSFLDLCLLTSLPSKGVIHIGLVSSWHLIPCSSKYVGRRIKKDSENKKIQ